MFVLRRLFNAMEPLNANVKRRFAYTTFSASSLREQEAQLSQRDSDMLRPIEYFAKSLKVTQGH